MNYGYCKHCGNEIYNDDYAYNGYLCCKECYEEAYSVDAIVKYIKSYPDRFAEYLMEEAVIQENPVLIGILEDYKEWQQEYFDEWVMN